MIQVYLSTNTNYDKNGDMALQPLSYEVSVSGINQAVEFTIEHEIDEYCRYEYLQKGNVIKAFTPWDLEKGQLFRIEDIDKDSKEGTIIASGYLLFYDNVKTYVKDFNNENVLICDTGDVTGEEAIKKIFKNTKYTGHSNIIKISRSRLERKNIVAALTGDDENSFVNRWGGELFIDNFDVYMNNKIGHDTGLVISYGRNMEYIKESSSYKNTITRIIPIGFDGLRLTGKTPWVDSPNIDKYPYVMEKEIKFDQVKVKEENSNEGFETIEEARAELIRLSKLLFEEEQIDSPEISIEVSMYDLQGTLEYKSYECYEEVNLGDYIKAKHELLNIDTLVRCIGYTWDGLALKYKTIKLGHRIDNYFDKQTDIYNKVNNILNSDGSVNAVEVAGILDAINVTMKACRDVAQPLPVRVMICEDFDKDSPSYGAMCFGSMGFMIAGERTPDDKDWDWRTFGTGKGFFADYIVAGTMLADRIKSGLLMSLNEKTWIDMDNGTFNFGNLLQFDGNEMRMKDTGFKIANSDNNIIAYIGQDNWMRLQGLEIFGIGECMQNKGAGTRSLKLITTDGGATHIDFNGNPYDDYTVRIIREAGSEYLKMLTKGLEVQSFTPNTPCGLEVRSHGNSAYLDFSYNAIDDYNVRLIVHNNDRNLHCHGDGLIVHGNLQITGNKNCIQNTKNYGQVAFYAVEDCESYFTDRSMELFTVEETEEGTYERVILLDNVFKEAVNLKKYSYTIEIVKQSWGDYRIKEQTSNYFIVESDRKDFTFKYAVIAKRKGYENVRLEEYFYNESEVINEQ